MREFMKNTLEWILDKEEQSANAHHIPQEQIDKQIASVKARRDKYQAECEDTLKELDHVLSRLHEMRDKNRDLSA